MDKSLFQLWNFQRLHTIYIWPYKYRQNSLVCYCLDQNRMKQFLFVATISEMCSASLLSFSIARNAVWHQVELLYTWTLRHATCRLNYAKVPSRPKTSSVLEGKEMSKVIWCALYKIAFTVYKNNVIHNTCVLSTFICALLWLQCYSFTIMYSSCTHGFLAPLCQNVTIYKNIIVHQLMLERVAWLPNTDKTQVPVGLPIYGECEYVTLVVNEWILSQIKCIDDKPWLSVWQEVDSLSLGNDTQASVFWHQTWPYLTLTIALLLPDKLPPRWSHCRHCLNSRF